MRIRPFTSDDDAAVNALHRSVWWPERSSAGWRWLEANPALADIDAPPGWVIEDEAGVPAAFLGNLVQRFWQGDTRLNGATGFSIIVPPTVRGKSRDLIQTFLKQPGLFAAYTFNANARSAPLYARHRMVPWPLRTSGLKLSWVIDPLACLHARVLRHWVKRAPTLSDPYRERFLNRRVGSARLATLPPGVSPLFRLDEASPYAAFWTALRAEGRVIADRSPAMLHWRLKDPDQTLPPIMLTYSCGERITGFAMAVLSKVNPIEPVCLEILDMVALQDDAEAIPAMMQGLLDHAKAQGAAKVRLNVVTDDLLDRLGPHARTARHEGGWGHCHVLFTPNGPDPDTWSPTPYDGDYGICQRPVPIHLKAPRRLAIPAPTARQSARVGPTALA